MTERTYDANDLANPSHYRNEKGECIDAMPEHFREWLKHECGLGWPGRRDDVAALKAVRWMMVGFCVGSAFKYRWRRGRKDDVSKEDAKASWYDAFALHVLDERHPDPRDARKP